MPHAPSPCLWDWENKGRLWRNALQVPTVHMVVLSTDVSWSLASEQKRAETGNDKR